MSIIPDPPAPTASDLARNRAQLLQEIAMRPYARRRRGRNQLMAKMGSVRTSRPATGTHGSPRPVVRRTVLLAAAAVVLAGGMVATDAVNLFWRAPATAEAVEALNGAAQQTINTL